MFVIEKIETKINTRAHKLLTLTPQLDTLIHQNMSLIQKLNLREHDIRQNVDINERKRV